MKIEVRNSNPAVVDPPLEVWLCPTTDGQGAVLMGRRGDVTAKIGHLSQTGLELYDLPETLGLQRNNAGCLFTSRFDDA